MPSSMSGALGGGRDLGELVALLLQPVDDLQGGVLSQDSQDLALRLASPRPSTSGRLERMRRGARLDGPAPSAQGPAGELLGLAAQGLLVLGRAELVAAGCAGTRRRPCGTDRRGMAPTRSRPAALR